jgi:hypothetical protein
MGFITGVVDVQDATGKSVVVQTADGTRPALVVKMGAGVVASYAKSGDQGIVTLAAAAALSGTSLTLGGQTPPQAVVDALPAFAAATMPVPLARVTIPLNKYANIELDVTFGLVVPALGFCTLGRWVGTIWGQNGGMAILSGQLDDTGRSNISSPFALGVAPIGNNDPAGLLIATSGADLIVTVTPIDLVTPFVGGGVSASGAWAASQAVTGSVQGSGTSLGLGVGNNILAAHAKWYFYTTGTTAAMGTGPSHTSGSAADGTATAYYGGTVAAGVPMVVTVTWRKIEIGP